MADLELTAAPRIIGKNNSRALRRAKHVPAVLYGPKIENINISLSEKEVEKYSKQKFENTIFVLKSDDTKINGIKVLKKETDIHPLTRRPVHLDLFALDLTQKVRVFVELRFEGKCIGVKEGGILNTVKRDVEVECLPTQIPEYISVDVTNLAVGESIHASEITVPGGIELITPHTSTLVTVITVEEESAKPVAAAAVDGAAAPAADGAAAPKDGTAAAKAEEKKK